MLDDVAIFVVLLIVIVIVIVFLSFDLVSLSCVLVAVVVIVVMVTAEVDVWDLHEGPAVQDLRPIADEVVGEDRRQVRLALRLILDPLEDAVTQPRIVGQVDQPTFRVAPGERAVVEGDEVVVAHVDLLNAVETDEGSLAHLVDTIMAEVETLKSSRGVERASVDAPDAVVTEVKGLEVEKASHGVHRHLSQVVVMQLEGSKRLLESDEGRRRDADDQVVTEVQVAQILDVAEPFGGNRTNLVVRQRQTLDVLHLV